jgi:hypothetical protein
MVTEPQGKVVKETEPQGKVLREKVFRLPPEEDAKLEKLIELAFEMGYITKPTFQHYAVFAINCTAEFLKTAYQRRKMR